MNIVLHSDNRHLSVQGSRPNPHLPLCPSRYLSLKFHSISGSEVQFWTSWHGVGSSGVLFNCIILGDENLFILYAESTGGQGTWVWSNFEPGPTPSHGHYVSCSKICHLSANWPWVPPGFLIQIFPRTAGGKRELMGKGVSLIANVGRGLWCCLRESFK